jgi:arsenite methyltransferase
MHQDPKAYIAMLENPQRDAEQKPDEVIKTLYLKEGVSIADIGAGSGYFSFRFSRQAGASGRVYAVDINPDMILYMNRHIRETKIKNVVTVLSDPDNPLLLDNSIDLFFVCNAWHHVPNRPQYLALTRKMLKQGGRIAIIDYKKGKLPVGPPPDSSCPQSIHFCPTSTFLNSGNTDLAANGSSAEARCSPYRA